MIELDYEKEPKPATQGEVIFLCLFGGVMLAGFTAEVLTDYQPMKLAALFFVLAWAPLLFLHELGHALVARAVGWRVDRFVIGYGKLLKEFEFAGAKCEFRLVPVTGYIVPRPTKVQGARWKSGLIYFAGPGIELIFFAVAYLTIGIGSFTAPTDNYFLILLKGAAVAAVFGAVTNLIPMTARTVSGSSPNDGLGILLSFITPKKEFERHIERRIDEHDRK